MAALGDKYVGRLDIAVDDAIGVGGIKGIGDLNAERQNLVGLERAIGDAMFERYAVKELHDDEGIAILFAYVMNRADVRMVQRGSRLGLPLEAAESLRIFGYFVRQELESDETVQTAVFRLVHHAHSTAAQLFQDAIVRNCFPEHWREMLRAMQGQVNETSAVVTLQSRRMKAIPWRVQVGFVAAAYGAVVLVSALLLYQRHLLYVNHAADAAAAGGMYAGGDLILELLIGGLFLMPSFLLLLLIRQSEPAYTRYAQIVLGLSMTAPVCLGISLIPAVGQSNSLLGWVSMYRLFMSPVIIVGIVVSRLLARFSRAKRLMSYALLIEAGTVVFMVLLFMWAVRARH